MATQSTPIENGKLLKQLADSMIKSGKTIVAEEPIWVAKTVFTVLKREDGVLANEGRTIMFRGLTGDAAPLNGMLLRLKGNGPLVRVCEAVAARDKEGVFNDKPWKITKGDKQIRCFS